MAAHLEVKVDHVVEVEVLHALRRLQRDVRAQPLVADALGGVAGRESARQVPACRRGHGLCARPAPQWRMCHRWPRVRRTFFLTFISPPRRLPWHMYSDTVAYASGDVTMP